MDEPADYDMLEWTPDEIYLDGGRPFTGTAVARYENGNLNSEVNFLNGKHHGLYRSFTKDGILVYEANYVDGKVEGLELEWYEDGKKKTEALYRNGEFIGIEEWDENGVLIRTWKDRL